MPPSYRDEGIVALESMRAGGSTIGVLLLSMYATPEYALRVMGAGSGTGYLLKERVSEPQTLVRAVETVASGGSVVDPEVVEQLVKRPERMTRSRDSPNASAPCSNSWRRATPTVASRRPCSSA